VSYSIKLLRLPSPRSSAAFRPGKSTVERSPINAGWPRQWSHSKSITSRHGAMSVVSSLSEWKRKSGKGRQAILFNPDISPQFRVRAISARGSNKAWRRAMRFSSSWSSTIETAIRMGRGRDVGGDPDARQLGCETNQLPRSLEVFGYYRECKWHRFGVASRAHKPFSTLVKSSRIAGELIYAARSARIRLAPPAEASVFLRDLATLV
jgi:hypothetical protein